MKKKQQSSAETDESQEKESQADRLVKIGKKAELFTDEQGEAYAAVKVDRHIELLKVRGKNFKLWITKQYHDSTRKIPNAEAMNQALGLLEALAAFEGEVRKLHLRVAELEGDVYYDLADKEWRVIRVNEEGCEILESPPILFTRNKNTKAQVTPELEGDVKKLLKHVKLKNEDDRILYLVYIVSCLIPEIAHPVLVLCGEKGAAKTTAMRITRAVVDPAERDILVMPNSIQDLALSLASNYMPCFDNMDTLSGEKSDLLCTASTGGGFSKRKLYSDDDETILNFRRCVGLNGINVVVTRADLLDRSIILELERIDETERREERDVWEQFEADKAEIIGGALMAVSNAMEICSTVRLERLGRMADFTRWGYAIAEALNLDGDRFLKVYKNNQGKSNDEAVSSHPVASAIIAFMEERDNWEGTMSTLLDILEQVAAREKIDIKQKAWAKAAHSLSRRLNEVKSNLKQVGITFDNLTQGDAKIISLQRKEGTETVRK